MNDFAPLARRADEPTTEWSTRLLDHLSARHLAGSRVPVEVYLERVPGLAAERQVALDLVVGEWMLRQHDGDAPTLAEYLQRFPVWQEEIRTLWELEQQTPDPARESPAGEPLPDLPVWYTGTVAFPVIFGDYHLLREFEGGGMGRVFLAEPVGGGTVVALKVPRLLEHDLRTSAVRRQRFLREARLTQKLTHPRLCRVLEVGECEGLPYFTMPYYPGGSVSAELQQHGPFDEQEAARLIAEVARALQHAHDCGILHRDLKPSNFLRDEQGRVVVTDFGLARLLEEEGPSLTSTGHLVGTTLYLSPEQATGKRALTPASDIFSLGVVLYELLVGQPPFTGNMLEVLQAIAQATPAPLEQLRPGVSPALAAICRRALAKEPRERYASMNELATELESFLAGTWTPKVPPASATIDMKPYRPKRRNWWLIGTGVALLSLVGALLLRGFLGNGDSPQGLNGPRSAATRTVVSARKPLGLRGQLQALHDDLASLEATIRPHVRYFSLQAVHDNPYLSDAELNLYPDALKRVLKRLSRKLPEVPVHPDPSGGLLRIDLRDLDWDGAHEWSDLLKAEPYGVRYDAIQPDEALRKLAREIVHLTASLDAPCVRADWFIAAATHAPLYDHLQQLEPGERRTPPFDLTGNDLLAQVVKLYQDHPIDARVAAAELGLGSVAELDAHWPETKRELRQELERGVSRSRWGGEEGVALFAECVRMVRLGVPRAVQPLR